MGGRECTAVRSIQATLMGPCSLTQVPLAGGRSGRRQRMVSGVIARPELDSTSAQDAAVLCPPVATCPAFWPAPC